jgi:hypothetical protein
MSQRWLAVGVPLVALVALGLTPFSSASSKVEPAVAAWVARGPTAAPPDTLRANATTDTPLILSLPADLNGVPITRYTVLRGPALCGVAGRSFTWVPKSTAPGTYAVHLHAHSPDADPDTLVVQIDLTE